MSEYVFDMVAFNCSLSCVSDLLSVRWRQELVVFRVKQMQKLSCLGARQHTVRLVVNYIGILKNLRNEFLMTKKLKLPSQTYMLIA